MHNIKYHTSKYNLYHSRTTQQILLNLYCISVGGIFIRNVSRRVHIEKNIVRVF